MRFALGVLFGALLCVLAMNSPVHIQKHSVRVATGDKALAATTSVQSQPEKNAVAASAVIPQTVLSPHQQLMKDAGIASTDWADVDYIVSHESGWCLHKWEGEIGYCPSAYAETYPEEDAYVGYGMCQSTPAIKMATTGIDWRDNAVTQLKWCNAYAQSRYVGWHGARLHWESQVAVIGHGNW